MITIYKYPLSIRDINVLPMPKGAKILKADLQQGMLCLWALVDTEAPLEERNIKIYGTGHIIAESDRLEYIDTFQLLGGELVFHIFEEA